jgi:outer membrane protein assembly factor BamB
VAADAKPPVKFDLKTNVRWSLELPSGHSSPVIWKDKLFITGIQNGTFETICIDRDKGTVLWRTAAPPAKIEPHHADNSPASSTPLVDENHVYVYFGSYGLLCYDHQGKELWKHAVSTPKNMHGTATSPIVYQQLLYLMHDSMDGDSYILAVDKNTGKEAWKSKRLVFNPNWSTPAIWPTDKGDQLIVLGGGALKAYAPLSGKELWTVPGFGAPIPVPVVGEGYLYASTTSGTEAGMNDSPLRWKYYTKFDKNKDGMIHVSEIPAKAFILFNPDLPESKMPTRGIVSWMDRNKDNAMTQKEFQQFLDLTNLNVRSSIKAIKLGTKADADSAVEVAWKYERSIPHMSSCIYVDGKVYLANNGGRVTCLDARTGKVIYRKRLGNGVYSASPVSANGNIYISSQDGAMTVFKAGDDPKVLATNGLGERINASPAIADDTIYVRTDTHLYAFSE